jgi:hypothetical protein
VGGSIMAITSRAEFGEYCLRRLGKPVININVAPEQVDDRIDEAIQAWHEKHYDATEKLWVGYALTAQDIANGYITLPDSIFQVIKMVDMSSLYNKNNFDGVFSYQYQFMLQNLSPWQPLDMINYVLTMESINTVNDLVNVTNTFAFTKHKNKLLIHNGLKDMEEGKVICFYTHQYINPDEVPKAWNDKWLKAYATALIKQQFGQNMKKHGEIQLLGGVTVNGQQIFDEATAEIEKLEETLQNDYQEPIDFFMS